MNFDKNAESKISSIKCHHPPGGSSNFSLGWQKGTNEPIQMQQKNLMRNNNLNILTNTNNGEVDVKTSNVLNLVENKENYSSNNVIIPVEVPNGNVKSSIKVDFKKSNFNLFNNECNVNIDKPNSIKVTYAPGGKSTILLGNDTTSYDEYRKKR